MKKVKKGRGHSILAPAFFRRIFSHILSLLTHYQQVINKLLTMTKSCDLPKSPDFIVFLIRFWFDSTLLGEAHKIDVLEISPLIDSRHSNSE